MSQCRGQRWLWWKLVSGGGVKNRGKVAAGSFAQVQWKGVKQGVYVLISLIAETHTHTHTLLHVHVLNHEPSVHFFRFFFSLMWNKRLCYYLFIIIFLCYYLVSLHCYKNNDSKKGCFFSFTNFKIKKKVLDICKIWKKQMLLGRNHFEIVGKWEIFLNGLILQPE